ncbi:MAG: LTA synthase family protein [Candidatus Dactylopiibacterium sp.]|nr:LTA synthase family protein [Candidatus Dactylopiibacterium sp.]
MLLLLLSCLLERALLRPRAAWRRPAACWLLHAGSLLALAAAGLALTGRPLFAVAQALAWWLFILVVNRVKLAALREPFIFQDFEYFLDMLRHPRLYIPFFGYANAALGLSGAALLIGGALYFEPVRLSPFAGPGYFIVMALAVALAGGLLLAGWHGVKRVRVGFDAGADLQALGLVGAMWRYALAERERPAFAPAVLPGGIAATGMPHLVAVQSESFFDARRAWPGIAPHVYAWLDQARAGAMMHGTLEVPAWGANTVRSEFAFLSGQREQALGVHRFNPYRCLRDVPVFVHALREAGYRTVCVHPYARGFYRRSEVFPTLGFDEFIDVEAFEATDRAGPYVGDVALARKVSELLERSGRPTFVFVISMENHGPLHLEQASAREMADTGGAGAPDLAVYLRHVRNAGRMLEILQQTLRSLPRAGWLCWYGDHVPILPQAYAAAGFEDSRTDYFIWSSRHEPRRDGMPARPLEMHALARAWLAAVQDAAGHDGRGSHAA